MKTIIKKRIRNIVDFIEHSIGNVFFKPLNSIAPALFDNIFYRKKMIHTKSNKSISHRDFGPEARIQAKTSMLKEPSTIIWLETFKENANFLDVGASVGVFSLYAAKLKNAYVVALEPYSPAYNLLNLNIFDNHLGDKIISYPLAAYSSEGFSALYLRHFSHDAGGSNFGKAQDPRGDVYDPVFIQGAYHINADNLLIKHEPFHYIKIDIDGNEVEALKGMKKILSSTDLISVLIELNENSEDYNQIISTISSYNLTLNSEITSKSYISYKRGSKIYNHIFDKKM